MTATTPAPAEAVIFVGIQGSGKSTFYRERFSQTHVRVSLDEVRTRGREQQLIAECLAAGRSFVVDNTNPTANDRARYIAVAHAAGFRVIAYYFRVPLRDAIQRNNQRILKQKVPVAAIVAAFKKLQVPMQEEGFDEVYTVKLNGENQFVVTPGANLRPGAEKN